MKYEWKKIEKDLYLPKERPTLITIKPMPFFVIEGKGDPNTSEDFKEAVQALYSLSYGVKMMPKSGTMPVGYYEYTVFPLEGIWDMSEAPTDLYNLDKDKFEYSLMIRQPDFVSKEVAHEVIEKTKKKKDILSLNKVHFEMIEDGLCVQMMHIGSYDDEPKSFALMDQFCKDNDLERTSHTHREIYLSDPRKVSKDKMRTVVRIMVKPKTNNL
jgi:hypothetical protein